jgi:hypothetical protein
LGQRLVHRVILEKEEGEVEASEGTLARGGGRR